jgi:hypothetical protein
MEARVSTQSSEVVMGVIGWHQRWGSGGHISLEGVDVVDLEGRVGEGATWTQTWGMVGIEDRLQGSTDSV